MNCIICHEPIFNIGTEWFHQNGGDTYCGTGDGSTAYPDDSER